MRQVGVTKLALGDFEATIEPLPIEQPKVDEGRRHEARDLHDIDVMGS